MRMRIATILILLTGFLYSTAQTFTSSNLPIIVINTNGQAIVDEPKITANMASSLMQGMPVII